MAHQRCLSPGPRQGGHQRVAQGEPQRDLAGHGEDFRVLRRPFPVEGGHRAFAGPAEQFGGGR
ncbi:hypothetical protein, partial [Streptomyces sp. Wh19]|uniref:hypothetical protein n=1 Tax=Streptomyces sp. Wh19 TaxID=3076629 RepID=UPI002958738C